MPSRSPAKSRVFEMALWGVILCAGALVLIPALAEWIQADRLEASERTRAEEAEREMAKMAHKLEWTLSDPQAYQKIAERQALDARKTQDDD
jgi:hypothetical protein